MVQVQHYTVDQGGFINPATDNIGISSIFLTFMQRTDSECRNILPLDSAVPNLLYC